MWSESFVHYTKVLANKKYTPLGTAEERSLLEQYSTGSQKAFDKLIESHLRFVVYFLRNYKVPTDIDIMDLIQEGNIGLIEGIKRFDHKKFNCRVVSYCMYYVRFYMNMYLAKYNKTKSTFVDIPSKIKNNVEDPNNVMTDDSVEKDIVNDIMSKSFDKLSPKEKAVITLFFGLDKPHQPKTLKEIGAILHISAENVRIIKLKALKKVKYAANGS